MMQRVRLGLRGRGTLLADTAIGVVVAVVVAIAISADLGGDRRPDGLAYLFAICFGALMLVRRHFPVLALVATGAGLVAYYAAGYPAIGLAIPVVAALYSAAEAGRIGWAVGTALALHAISTTYRLLVGQSPIYLLRYELASSVALMAGAIALGYSIRARRALRAEQRAGQVRAALELEREAGRRVEEERLRIARDIHDVLAHTIAVISVQANVASDAVADDPDAAKTALATIQGASDDAAREMRSTLGLLGDGDDAQPRSPAGSLRQLDALVRATRDSGLPVDVRIEGQPGRIPAAVDATAYRIVRESLTNSLRHSGAGRVGVVVRHDARRLDIQVRDDGPARAEVGGTDGQAPRGGWGITGMSQRAALLGGNVEAGPTPTGGFCVHASLPLEIS